jgi:hypothetical protein
VNILQGNAVFKTPWKGGGSERSPRVMLAPKRITTFVYDFIILILGIDYTFSIHMVTSCLELPCNAGHQPCFCRIRARTF